MSYVTALWFAIVQGITELFPVSSVAHAVLLPAVFSLPINLEGLLPFTVMLHLGTALALLLFYWREWTGYLISLLGQGEVEKRQVLLRLVVATLPAALIGALFLKALRAHFPSATSAAFFLIINGLILWMGDRQRSRALARRKVSTSRGGEDAEIVGLSWGACLFIGLAQSLALIPGFSRSGMSITAGLLSGLSYEAAARFAFLLATPIILGAGLVEIPRLFHHGFADLLGPALVGGAGAGLAAYFSVWILTRYFHTHEVKALRPFALYCILMGLATLCYLKFLRPW
ncbi:undecaprenyl-diphosphate phosphatase [Desulfothermobacter acidiphilus]|uniref:undecaprenyl-diphosphate phosphatase n=1 Tax=Desulfothermobacter acidiphilus TaxID=1938353 RepID=UPI003F8C3DA0